MLRKGQELFWVAAYYITSQKIKERNDPNRLPYSLPGTLEKNPAFAEITSSVPILKPAWWTELYHHLYFMDKETESAEG